MKKKLNYWPLIIAAAALVILMGLAQYVYGYRNANITQMMSIKEEIREASISIDANTQTIDYILENGSRFETTLPKDINLSTVLPDDVILSAKGTFDTAGTIQLICFLLVSGTFLFYLWRKRNAQETQKESMQQSKKVGKVIRHSDVRFKDVAGCDEEKAEIREIIDFLNHPKRFTDMGASIPKGVLFVGPPGTGKTLLAKAIAGEAGVYFQYVSASEFVEMYVGVGAKRVRELFEEARKHSPSILFIDEIDAIAKQRSSVSGGGGSEERDQTLNQLLVEMDGFEKNNIIVIGATNRPENLDKALLRPGRFDRQITIGLPDTKARFQILSVHAKTKKMDPDVDLHEVAKKTHGFSGAELYKVLNEAALLAVRYGKTCVGDDEIEEAIDRVLLGHSKRRKYSEREKRMVAYHESGHVLLGHYLNDASKVTKVTIIPRGDAGGYAMITPKNDRFMTTKDQLMEQICGLMAGRMAEKMIFSTCTTGAQDDLRRVKEIVQRMVYDYGMSEEPEFQDNVFGERMSSYSGFEERSLAQYSDQIKSRLEDEVQKIISRCARTTNKILLQHRKELDALAAELYEKEVLYAKDIQEILQDTNEKTAA